MKSKFWFNGLFIIGLIVLISTSCKKNDDDTSSNTVKDIDGNVYHTVTIGTQVWMVENLKTTKYNDGTPIPLVKVASSWSSLSTPAYCWYNNDKDTYQDPYGALYNWYAVNTGKLCPPGYHVPTDIEWNVLIDYLGGEDAAGGKLKEIGTSHWLFPNIGANNECGFTALSGGYCCSDGTFDYVGFFGHWWSSSDDDTGYAWYRYMGFDLNEIYRDGINKQFGFSVRCLRDK